MINLLITGGAGFIGSNLANFWLRHNPNDFVVVLDKLTYAGNKDNLSNLIKNKNNFCFIEGDICDFNLVSNILRRFSITHIAHLAAESHVDRSLKSPESFIKTNIYGTYSLLESFHNYWNEKEQPGNFRFLHVSTDEVFGSLSMGDSPFNEKSSYSPRSPYSASKASSDHLARSWFESYKLPVLISNCSNNYGPYHYPEKLIPLTIINILLNRQIPVYGSGNNIRDWLFVEDHCRALELILKSKILGESYCIGACNEKSNIDLVNMICDQMDQLIKIYSFKRIQQPSRNLIKFVKDREGHDFRYSINSSKIQHELGWQSLTSLEDGIKTTISWYLDNVKWWKPLLSSHYKSYIEKQYPEII